MDLENENELDSIKDEILRLEKLKYLITEKR